MPFTRAAFRVIGSRMSNVLPLPGIPIERDGAVPLSPEWVRFAEEWTVDFNVVAASHRSGVEPAKAHQALRDPRVVALVRENQRKLAEKVQVSVSLAMNTLSRIARADLLDYVEFVEHPAKTDLKGDPMPPVMRLRLDRLNDDQRAAIKSIKWTQHGPQIELFDKVAAVNQMGKFFGIWTDGIKLTGIGVAPPTLIEAGMTPEQAADLYQQTIKP